MMKTMVGQAVPLQPMDDPMLEQVDTPKGGCDLMESLCWSRLLAGPLERSPYWSRFAGRTLDPGGNPHTSNLFLKDCTSWEAPVLEQFMNFSL